MTPTPQLGSPRPSRKSTEEGEKAAVAPPRESQLLNQSPLHTHFRVAQLVGCASLTTVLGWATFAVPSTLSPAGRLLPKGSDAAGAAGLGPLGPSNSTWRANSQLTHFETLICSDRGESCSWECPCCWLPCSYLLSLSPPATRHTLSFRWVLLTAKGRTT